MSNLDSLIRQIAKSAGLSDELAQAVFETAVEYVKAMRPEKADQVDAVLADEDAARQAGELIARLSKKVDL